MENVTGIVKGLIGIHYEYPGIELMNKELYVKLTTNKTVEKISNLCTVRTEVLRNQMSTKNMLSNKTTVYCLGYSLKGTVLSVLKEINQQLEKYLDSLDCYFMNFIDKSLLKSLLLIEDFDNLEKLVNYFLNNIEYYPNGMFFNFIVRDCVDIFKSDTVFLTAVSVLRESAIQNETLDKFLNSSAGVCIIVDCENTNVFKFYGFLKTFRPDQMRKVKRVILVNDTQHLQSSWSLIEDFPKDIIEYVDVDRIVKNKSRVDLFLTIMVCKYSYGYGVRDIIIVSSDSDYTALLEQIMISNFLVVYDKNNWSNKAEEFCFSHFIKTVDINQFIPDTIDGMIDRVITNSINEILAKDYTIKFDEIVMSVSTKCQLKNTDLNAIILSKLKDLRFNLTNTEIIPFVERDKK